LDDTSRVLNKYFSIQIEEHFEEQNTYESRFRGSVRVIGTLDAGESWLKNGVSLKSITFMEKFQEPAESVSMPQTLILAF
jgi:hypothetical protein